MNILQHSFFISVNANRCGLRMDGCIQSRGLIYERKEADSSKTVTGKFTQIEISIYST